MAGLSITLFDFLHKLEAHRALKASHKTAAADASAISAV